MDKIKKRLLDEVLRHVAGDQEEGLHREHILRFVDSSERPMDRTVQEPGHITGSAFIVSEDRKYVLLIHHAKLNRWLQPGGHCEAGEEEVMEVARREAREEVNVETGKGVLWDVDVHAIPARGDVPGHFHFDLRYLFEVPKNEVNHADEVLAAKWFSVEEAMGVVDGGLKRMIRKLTNASR